MKTKHTHWEQDFEHWIEKGTSKSTQRAYRRDVDYYWQWCHTHYGDLKVYPATVERILQFCLYHISETSPAPLKLSTVRRYLGSLSVAHSESGYPSPTSDPKVKILLRRARAAKQEWPDKKTAITLPLLHKLVSTCDASLIGVRDKAILLVGFASGGRRRDELVSLRLEDLEPIENGYLIQIRKSKNDQRALGHTVPLYGEAALALKTWIIKSGLRSGPLFRGIKFNQAFYRNISGRTINMIVKRRIKMIGLDPDEYGAHSIRAGFLTESARQGIHLTQAMALSGHKTLAVASEYCRDIDILNNKAGHLV